MKYYAVSEARESWPRSRREIAGESVIRRVFRNAEIGRQAPPEVGGVFQQPPRLSEGQEYGHEHRNGTGGNSKTIAE